MTDATALPGGIVYLHRSLSPSILGVWMAHDALSSPAAHAELGWTPAAKEGHGVMKNGLTEYFKKQGHNKASHCCRNSDKLRKKTNCFAIDEP
jgi:hypothetical protein